MRSLESIIEKLNRAQGEMLSAADGVPADQWKTRPAEGRWSAGELVAHVGKVERSVLGQADKLLQDAPRRVPFYKRFHFPLKLVESRMLRRRSPRAMEPQNVGDKEIMLADLREARERTLAFIEETRDRDLSRYTASHHFLGTMNAYEWLQFIAAHEIRHAKQMREIATALPKIVTTSQK